MSRVDASVPGKGLTTFMASGADGSTALTNVAQVVAAASGRIYGYSFKNVAAAASFISFYDVPAASVTVGTTEPFMQIGVIAATADSLALPYGIMFAGALSVAATTTAGGNSAPVTAVDLLVWYALDNDA